MITASTERASTIIQYKPQIDGLRCIAVFVVVLYHYMPIYQVLGGVLDIGNLLAFFFVLSSYLITKILLISKERGLEAGYSKHKIGLAFLTRRTLRIFPAYYFYLLLVLYFPIEGKYLRENVASFFLYASNFQIYADQEWGDLTAHLWTLAVEEQFYIVWPWVILFTPSKHLFKVFALTIGIGVVSRLVLFYATGAAASQMVTYEILTPTCIDGFGFGALLAYWHLKGKDNNPILIKALLFTLPLWLLLLYVEQLGFASALGRIVVALMAMVVIEGANKGFSNALGRFLENKVVLYLAKISYGIYLYHIFAVFILWEALRRANYLLLKPLGIDINVIYDVVTVPAVSFIIYILLSVGLASASWYFLERPINSLKRFFTYTKPPQTPEPQIPSPVPQPQLVKKV